MSWLSSIESLAHLLERQAEHWICFLHYETPLAARHPLAADQSHEGRGAVENISETTWIRCFFAPYPIVECREFIARDFYSQSCVRQGSAGVFLIPYYPLDEFETPQPLPFLKFSCPSFLELSGPIDALEPQLRSRGQVLERCWDELNALLSAKDSRSSDAVIADPILVEKSDSRREESNWKPSESKQSLRDLFESLQTLMRNGESYLANASTRLYGPKRQDTEVSLNAFVARWVHSPSRYGVFVGCGSELPAVVCFSPERFVLRRGSTLITEPIKGTATADDSQPFSGASALWNSTKEMCEQKMVTDLLRNDLNSLCVPGSVHVQAPFAMRRAGDLLQMQSVICAQLQDPHISAADIFRKMLPAGSVTGTPKHAVGQQLRALEGTPRNYYTGLFALEDDAAHFESTLLIRGFFSGKEFWEAGIGAGITTLSNVDVEFNEFELKWRSFAQRWPQTPSKEQFFFSTEDCQKLLNAKTLTVSPESDAPQPEPIPVAVPCIELKSDKALDTDELRGSILFVDHLDSFSGNLLAALRAQGASVARVVSAPAVNKYARPGAADVSSSAVSKESILQWQEDFLALVEAGVFAAVVLSPGPGRPEDYRLSRQILSCWPGAKPLLGVCLGHQLLLASSGCVLQRVASTPVHGRSQPLQIVEKSSCFAGVNLDQQECTFYNSWNVSLVEALQHAPEWRVCAVVGSTGSQKLADSKDSDAVSVALCEHRTNPWIGVQFHPESFATVPGKSLLAAFVALCLSGA